MSYRLGAQNQQKKLQGLITKGFQCPHCYRDETASFVLCVMGVFSDASDVHRGQVFFARAFVARIAYNSKAVELCVMRLKRIHKYSACSSDLSPALQKGRHQLKLSIRQICSEPLPYLLE